MEDPRIGSVNFEIQVHNDYYFYFLSLIKVEFDKKVSTAGLQLEGIDFKISLNPDFWTSIKTVNYKKNQFLLLHEVYHLILKHYISYKDYDDKILFNIATDCYINYELIELVLKDHSYFIDGGVWYKDIGVPLEVVLEGSDSIYRYLSNSNNENFKSLYNQIKSQENVLIVDHDLWEKLNNGEIDSEVLDRILSKNVETLMTEANNYSKNMGSLPASLRRILDEILNRKESNVNWKKELRNFVSLYSNKIFVKKSFSKPSKFFDDTTTLKIKFKPKIAVIVDTSGSMSTNDLIECFTELEIISRRSEFDIKVIECDATITPESVYNYVNINTIRNRIKNKGVVGGGGTNVDPAIVYINKNCLDVASVIYITDGYVEHPKVKSLKPFVVLLTSKGKSIDSFKKSWNSNLKILKINEV